MTIRMKNWERLTLAEMKEFVTANRHVGWSAVERESVYGFIERALKAQQYRTQEANKRDAVQRLHEIVNAANQVKPMRYATRPTRASAQRRLETKTQRGRVKQLRGKIAAE